MKCHRERKAKLTMNFFEVLLPLLLQQQQQVIRRRRGAVRMFLAAVFFFKILISKEIFSSLLTLSYYLYNRNVFAYHTIIFFNENIRILSVLRLYNDKWKPYHWFYGWTMCIEWCALLVDCTSVILLSADLIFSTSLLFKSTYQVLLSWAEQTHRTATPSAGVWSCALRWLPTHC